MLTAEQLKTRKGAIGASELPALVGLPSYGNRNAYSIYLDKTDQLEPDAKNSDQCIDLGNRFEPALTDYAEEKYGKLERQVRVCDPSGAPIASTLDARIVASGIPVEIKTAGLAAPLLGVWGEDGTDAIPDGYLMQVTAQILCTEKEFGHLVALLGGRGIVNYTIQRSEPLIATIRAITTDFFERYISARRDPRTDWADRLRDVHHINVIGDPCETHLDVVKRIRRQPNKSIDIEDAAKFIAWQEARQRRLDSEKLEQGLLAECIAMLGDAEGATLPGGILFTYMLQKGPDVIDREMMKAAGIYDQYAKPNQYRVARISSPKKRK